MTTPSSGPVPGQIPAGSAGLPGPTQPLPSTPTQPVPPLPPQEGAPAVDPQFGTPAAQPLGDQSTLAQSATVEPGPEHVGRGLAVAFAAVLLGMGVSYLLGLANRYGGIGAWVASAGAVFGYLLVANGWRKGKFAVLGLMIVGTALCILTSMFAGYMKAYNEAAKEPGVTDMPEPVSHFFASLGQPDIWNPSALTTLFLFAGLGLAFGLWRWFKATMAYRAEA